jgi:Protein of unknown function (DUF3667)
MADEPAKFILGDTAISSVEEPPRRRRRKTKTPALTHCENCGKQLNGRWCGQCGQAAIDYRRSFRHVFIDVLDSFFNWDSKFFATIGWLIARPWFLTNQFLAGHRVRYLHPLRLYLLASILFFLAVTYWAKSIHMNPDKLSPRELSPQDRTEIETALKNKHLPPGARAEIEKAIKEESPPADVTRTEDAVKEKGSSPPPQNKAEETPKQSETNHGDFGPIQLGPENPSTPFERWLETRLKEKVGEHGTNAQLAFMALIRNLPYMVLCCIPLFAFVLKILYIRRRVFYIDHLIYALHIHTFAYVAIILIWLAANGLAGVAPSPLAHWTIGFLWFAFGVQILLSIRRVYRQSWFMSVLKFLVGGVAYLVVLLVALIATVFVTLALPD